MFIILYLFYLTYPHYCRHAWLCWSIDCVSSVQVLVFVTFWQRTLYHAMLKYDMGEEGFEVFHSLLFIFVIFNPWLFVVFVSGFYFVYWNEHVLNRVYLGVPCKRVNRSDCRRRDCEATRIVTGSSRGGMPQTWNYVGSNFFSQFYPDIFEVPSRSCHLDYPQVVEPSAAAPGKKSKSQLSRSTSSSSSSEDTSAIAVDHELPAAPAADANKLKLKYQWIRQENGSIARVAISAAAAAPAIEGKTDAQLKLEARRLKNEQLRAAARQSVEKFQGDIAKEEQRLVRERLGHSESPEATREENKRAPSPLSLSPLPNTGKHLIFINEFLPAGLFSIPTSTNSNCVNLNWCVYNNQSA